MQIKNAITFLRDRHQSVYKAFLFIAAVSILVYIFPKQAKFKYEYHNLKGKPWNHDNLIAPFDFAIRKSNTELEQEKAELLKQIKPYFIYNSDISEQQLKAYYTDFETVWKGNNQKIKERTFNAGKKILDSVYSRGILNTSEITDNKPSDFSIYVIKNNEEEEYDINDFFSISSAYEFIKNELNKKERFVDSYALLPILENHITHSVFYSKDLTEKIIKQSIDGIAPFRGSMMHNQIIIAKGEIVDAKKYQILESLKAEYEEQAGGGGSYKTVILGEMMLISLCVFVLIMFLSIFRKDIYADNTKVLFILFIVILEALMVRVFTTTQTFSIYLLPFCILPIMIRSFYDTRIALFVHLIAILITSFMATSPFEFIFIQLTTGIVTIFSIVNMHKRSQIFISASLIFITYSFAYIGINIINQGGEDQIYAMDFAWFGISAASVLFSYPLIFVFEKIFGFISDVSILELSDTNGKLLRKLAAIAPGTFQHSLQVANLAEEAIYNIGGNALLVRTGALYHDIGKMDNPVFFIENQSGGINPHQDLSYEDSASIIIEHVIKGIEIAKKNNIPEQIIDFIRTHHGTSYTGYFYRSFIKDFPYEHVNEEKFRYPGPIPFSKETAVLMMADSVEAASRSLKKYDAETIDKLVDSIINRQIEENQFVNANITFKDIHTIKKIFKKKLMNIYHVRVEYPR